MRSIKEEPLPLFAINGKVPSMAVRRMHQELRLLIKAEIKRRAALHIYADTSWKDRVGKP